MEVNEELKFSSGITSYSAIRVLTNEHCRYRWSYIHVSRAKNQKLEYVGDNEPIGIKK